MGNLQNIKYIMGNTLVDNSIAYNIAYNRHKNTPVYIICLTDNEFTVAKQKLGVYKLKNIKKFDAIRGDSLQEFITDKNNVTVKGLYDVSMQIIRGAHSELTGINSVGCYMSHVKLWEKIINDKLPGMIILESDCVCTGNIIDCLDKFLEVKNGHLLYFGYFEADVKYTGIITKINVRTYGLHAYYITNKCAAIMLKYAFPIEQQVDSYMADMLLLSQDANSFIPPLNVYVGAKLCEQSKHISTVQTKIVM